MTTMPVSDKGGLPAGFGATMTTAPATGLPGVVSGRRFSG